MGDARHGEGRVSPAPTESPAAKRDAHSHLSGGDRPAVQLQLFEDEQDDQDPDGEFGKVPFQDRPLIPNHRLHPAEWDLRRFVNSQPRSRPHWWIADLRRRSA